ncbi:unnamed protein product [Prunus armeniaca]
MVYVEQYEVDLEVYKITLRFRQSIPSANKAQQNEEVDSSKTEKKSKAKEIKVSLSKKTITREVLSSSSKAKDPKPDTGKTKESSQSHAVKYDILTHLKRIFTPLSVYDALQMLGKLREAFVMPLMSLDLYKSCFKSVDVHTTKTLKFCVSCLAMIAFGEVDISLRSKFHNRPLYITGEVGGTTIVTGSAPNLLGNQDGPHLNSDITPMLGPLTKDRDFLPKIWQSLPYKMNIPKLQPVQNYSYKQPTGSMLYKQ